MKIHELTKKYNLNFHNFKLHLEKLGFVGYKSPNKNIPESELPEIEEIARNFTETQVELDLEKVEKRKGRFMGIAYDTEGQMFRVLVINESYKDLVEKGVNFEQIEEKNCINSCLNVN